MIPAVRVLNEHGIHLPSYAPSRHYTTCPQCSASRTQAHRALKCLGVTIDADGSVRWGCNHCAWTGPSKGKGKGKGNGDGGEGEPLTFYVYRDKDGAILFRKVRNAPGREPRFFLQKWNGLGWERGAGGVDTSILYRADDLAKAIADGREVIVAEGEKDVDNLWRIGFAATCNPHGAHDPTKRQKPKWYASHSAQLKGADIVVLNDNDASGYAHADATCKLSLGVAKRVRRLDLKDHWPDIPKGGDVSDWVAQGHGREELTALIDGAPDYASGEAKTESSEAASAPIDEDAELARLANLSPIQYDRERAEAAKRLDVRTHTLDRLVAGKRAELGQDGDGLPGRPITFDEIEPWATPVDGEELLTELSATIGAYIVMDKHQRDAAALWAAHAHAHDFRDTSPPLVIKSPSMRSGKTKLVEVLERLVPRPLFISGITVSFLERAIEAHRPTLLIDEYDALTSNDPALADAARAQLNRSSKRRGARVGKNVPLPGGGYESRLFSTWAPSVIAGIGDPPSTVRDRAVVIDLKRKLSSEKVKPLRERDGADLAILRRKLARFVAVNEQRLRSADPAALAVDNDRAKDMWDPLLAVADVAGGDWPTRAREAGQALAVASESETAEADVKLVLLADIRDIFAEAFPPGHAAHEAAPEGRPSDGPRLASKRLLDALHGLEERPWSAWGKAKKSISGASMANLLRDFHIRSGAVRIDDGTGSSTVAKGYYLRAFEEAFSRYLPTYLPTPGVSKGYTVTNPGKQGQSEDFAKVTNSVCNGSENAGNASKSGVCNVVTAEKGGDRDSARRWPSPTPPAVDPPANASQRPTNSGAPAYEVLGPARPGQRCAICDGSLGVKRIRLGGKERPWDLRCADRYCAAMPAGTPEEIVATTRRAGASFDLSEDGTGFIPNLMRVTDPAIRNAVLDAIAANYEAILDVLRRETRLSS